MPNQPPNSLPQQLPREGGVPPPGIGAALQPPNQASGNVALQQPSETAANPIMMIPNYNSFQAMSANADLARQQNIAQSIMGQKVPPQAAFMGQGMIPGAMMPNAQMVQAQAQAVQAAQAAAAAAAAAQAAQAGVFKPPQQMQQQHAISYVTNIRNRFANEPETYR